jgi:hypothetical protein
MVEADLTVWSGFETFSAAPVSQRVRSVLKGPSQSFNATIDGVAVVAWPYHILVPDIFACLVGCVVDNVAHYL